MIWGDPVVAVPVGHVPDDVTAPAFIEVDVDVGHGHALGIEEPLEHQPVVEGIEVGDAQGVGHQAPRRRAAPGADPDPLLLAHMMKSATTRSTSKNPMDTMTSISKLAWSRRRSSKPSG